MFPGIYKVPCYHAIPLKMLNTVIVFQVAVCLLYTITWKFNQRDEIWRH